MPVRNLNLAAFLLIPALLLGERFIFEPQLSSVEVYVPRAGFLSVLGHDHTILVEDFSGYLDEKVNGHDGPQLVFEVPVEAMRVADEEVGEDTRTKIQKEMEGEAVLDQKSYPRIRFSATEIVREQNGEWHVRGDLVIRDVSRPVTFKAKVSFSDPDSVRAQGTVELKPKDFGIDPVTALGGAIRTAKTIELRFDVNGSSSKDK